MPRISRKTQQKRGSDRDSAKGPKRTANEALRDQAEIYSMWKNGSKLAEIVDTLGQLRNLDHFPGVNKMVIATLKHSA